MITKIPQRIRCFIYMEGKVFVIMARYPASLRAGRAPRAVAVITRRLAVTAKVPGITEIWRVATHRFSRNARISRGNRRPGRMNVPLMSL